MSRQDEQAATIKTPCGEASAREASYLLTLRELARGGQPPTQAALAAAMKVARPTTLEMVRRLRQLGLLERDSLALTNEGSSTALLLASRRRAARVLAHDLLGIADEQQADIEAARLAPNVSPKLIRRLLDSDATRKHSQKRT